MAQYIPDAQQRLLDEFVPEKIVEGRELATLSAALAEAARPLFQPCHKDLVACLCVQLEYVNAEHEALLGGIRGDVQHDPLDLFKCARGNSQRSRFEALFLEEDGESDALRRLFVIGKRATALPARRAIRQLPPARARSASQSGGGPSRAIQRTRRQSAGLAKMSSGPGPSPAACLTRSIAW